MYLFFTPIPSVLGCYFYVFETESSPLSCVVMLTILFVLKFETIFLRRILKGALLCHSILPNSIGSEILMIQTLYSKTALLPVNHCIRLLFLS